MSLPKSAKEELREAKKAKLMEREKIEEVKGEIDEKIEEIEVDMKRIKKGR